MMDASRRRSSWYLLGAVLVLSLLAARSVNGQNPPSGNDEDPTPTPTPSPCRPVVYFDPHVAVRGSTLDVNVICQGDEQCNLTLSDQDVYPIPSDSGLIFTFTQAVVRFFFDPSVLLADD